MRLYIAGPMSGYANFNFDEFNRVSKLLAEKGHEVYNPATSFQGRQDLPYDLYLRQALQMVTMCEGLVLLDGWKRSRGALTEAHVGLSCDMNFYILSGSNTLHKYHLTHQSLSRIMEDMYDAESNPVSEDHSGDSRKTESGQDYTLPSHLLFAP